MDIKELLLFSTSQNASDLHLSSGLPPMLRICGDIKKLNLPPLDVSHLKQMLYDIMPEVVRTNFEQDMEVDFAFEIDSIARFRVNVFFQARGIAAVFRVITSKIRTLEELNAPIIFKELASYTNGLVLVTGPTGSGKSTTLAAIIDYINEHEAKHILTIEDPIEFIHRSKKSLINQRELNTHTNSFSNALKSALREDPDCILVGEMRDLETIRLAISAAETGHLVFATLHTSSAAKTIDRVIDVFPVGEKEMIRTMLSESLKAVVSQTLIKKADNSGLVAAHEIMLVNPAIRNLIRENKISQINSVIQTSAQSGMQSMDQSLLKLLKSGVIDKSVAVVYAQIKEQFYE